MRTVHTLVRAILTLAAMAPWLWLAMFAASAVGATLHPGRAPGHNDPKPKPLVFGAGYGLAAAAL